MLLDRKTYVVKERVAFAKLTDVYDIFDADGGQRLAVAKEEPAAWAKWLRLLINKQLMPTTVNVYENELGEPLLTIHRGVALLRQKVQVTMRNQSLGSFRAKLFSLGGGFLIFGPQGEPIGEVKGDWKGWNFQLLGAQGEELGRVTKKWAGLGKELFTSADNYAIALSDAAAARKDVAALLLAAGLAIDVVFKERK